MTPLRLVPTLGGDNENVGVGAGGGISEESCVLGFGWGRSEAAGAFNDATLDFDVKANLRDIRRFRSLKYPS